MNILITGSCGFIGKHLQKALYEAGHHIYGYDLRDGLDIRDLHELDKWFELSQCTTVIHLAARAGVRRGNEYAHEYMTTNIEGTWNVGKMCEKYGCRLISFSSSSVYGNANPPTKEDDPKNPISLYGMTKLMGEHIVNQLTIPTVIIRPFTVYGEDGRGDQVFYKWINQYKAGKQMTVFNNGRNARGYTYVGDIINALVTLINMDWDWIHEDFNLGGQEIITIDSLLTIFMKIIRDSKCTFLNRPGSDIPENYACIDKAKEILNFNPPKQFKENITNIIRKELNINA